MGIYKAQGCHREYQVVAVPEHKYTAALTQWPNNVLAQDAGLYICLQNHHEDERFSADHWLQMPPQMV
jgi:hypothetical protein